MSESIGQRLKRLRGERGLSQRQLEAPGVSYAYISRIESGARQPSVKALRKLAPKLGVTTEYLETGEQMPSFEDGSVGWITWFSETATGQEIARAFGQEPELVAVFVWEALHSEFFKEQASQAS